MKITIIGSTSYQARMLIYKKELEASGHTVFIPAFDGHLDWDETQICNHNRSLIIDADEVHIIWDGRSQGTIFDLGMCFAFRKKVCLIHLNNKTIPNLIRQMESGYA